jgi:hypothetical protein
MGSAAIITRTVLGQGWLRTIVSWLADHKAERPIVLRQTVALGNRSTLALLDIDRHPLLVGISNGSLAFHDLPRSDRGLQVRGYVR